MARLLLVVGLLLAVTAPLRAEQYWVAYEGNDFPENEGWQRTASAGGAVRTLEGGNLVLDSRRSNLIVDYYQMNRPIDPAPGETFVMRWRLRIDEVLPSYPFDSVIAVFSDEFRGVGLEFAEDHVSSGFEPGVVSPFAPGLFHSYEVRSSDMLSYTLTIDGLPAISGSFQSVFTGSEVNWGDGVQGARSLSTWDEFEFGDIPEPTCAVMTLTLLVVNRRASGLVPNCRLARTVRLCECASFAQIPTPGAPGSGL